MQSLNEIKKKLKQELINDKFSLSKNKILRIKSEILEVFKKYTNLTDDSININIKILNSNKYLINIDAEVGEIF